MTGNTYLTLIEFALFDTISAVNIRNDWGRFDTSAFTYLTLFITGDSLGERPHFADEVMVE
jgi:hypothetical protein